MTTIGQRLAEERKRLRMSQARFGEAGGVKANAQGNYESDTRSPDASYLAAIAALGVDVNYIVTGFGVRDADRAPSKKQMGDFLKTYFEAEARSMLKNLSLNEIIDTTYKIHLLILKREIDNTREHTKINSKKTVNK